MKIKMQILHKITQKVIFEEGANLKGADLEGAKVHSKQADALLASLGIKVEKNDKKRS